MSAFDGTGKFVIGGTGLPFVSGVLISSAVVNQLDADLATGLTNTLCKDGQSTPIANLKMGGFKFTGLGQGSVAGDSVTFDQVLSGPTAWTPVAQGSTVAGAPTYGAGGQIGRYWTLMGNFVIAQFFVNVTAWGGATGGAQLGGLPFANGNANFKGPGFLSGFTNFSADTTRVLQSCFVGVGAQYISMVKSGGVLMAIASDAAAPVYMEGMVFYTKN